jgi:uncharacterized membrane protein YcaP (DUF421 family)
MDLGDFFDGVLGLSATKPEQLNTLQLCARAFVVYLVMIGYIRFAKKRFLSRATAFDAILVIMIGSVASRAITGNAPFVGTMAATFVLILCHWIISYFAMSSATLSVMTKGRDTTLIKNGRVDRKALRDAHMSDDDLAEDLREASVDDPRKVKEARLERSGKLSVIKEGG